MNNNKIYCMFSVENDYDQPNNNLVCFWHEKPSLEVVAKVLGEKFPSDNDETTLKIINIWSMKSQECIGNTGFRINLVDPGLVL